MRSAVWLTGLLALAPAVRADDAIPLDTVAAVKKATVFVRVKGDGWAASGSGFVAWADGDKAVVVTNHHVIAAPDDGEPGAKPGPAPAVSVVFDSGTSTERTATAEVVASDRLRDLAALRVTGVKDVPAPLTFRPPPRLVETTAVYTFGFPFGTALSTGAGNPAVTVGKASVSSLRNGDDGELSVIQIDGSLNPGNSGGPVVTARGRLAGVAVATIRDSVGIGLVIPGAEVGKLMAGRLGPVRVALRRADGKVVARVSADVLDPLDAIKTVSARYVVVPPRGDKPAGDDLAGVPAAKPLPMVVTGRVAWAEVTFDEPGGELFAQAVGAGDDGRTVLSAVKVAPLRVFDPDAAPPAGWKEWSPKDRSFAVWAPEKRAKSEEHQRAVKVDGNLLSRSILSLERADGTAYRADAVGLPAAFAKMPRKDIYDLFRAILSSEAKGRVSATADVQLGTLNGREYVYRGEGAAFRGRVFVSGGRVFLAVVSGKPAQVTDGDADTFLDSFRRTGGGGEAVAGGFPTPDTDEGTVVPRFPVRPGFPTPPPVPRPIMPTMPRPALPVPPIGIRPRPPLPGRIVRPAPDGGGNPPAAAKKGDAPKVLGVTFDPPVLDFAPAGGHLVGLEVGYSKFFDYDIVTALRPIYRTNGVETLGKQQGTDLTRVVKVKAKAGYAVGAIKAKTGLGIDGVSLTFMKIAGDKLDPSDSYESEYYGGPGGGGPNSLGGDGTPVVGLVTRANKKDVNAVGLLYPTDRKADDAEK